MVYRYTAMYLEYWILVLKFPYRPTLVHIDEIILHASHLQYEKVVDYLNGNQNNLLIF